MNIANDLGHTQMEFTFSLGFAKKMLFSLSSLKLHLQCTCDMKRKEKKKKTKPSHLRGTCDIYKKKN